MSLRTALRERKEAPAVTGHKDSGRGRSRDLRHMMQHAEPGDHRGVACYPHTTKQPSIATQVGCRGSY
ncbi:Hypothetical predicted protein [Pelobates cultripes]|uniref:Uncharacterized protein n=1 Tax=Pelobates cultripes TaxID=61616 RepID=A0AAD1W4M0_PELCU|nr:Hypothetical predicted protein [Pelobates cultripes]